MLAQLLSGIRQKCLIVCQVVVPLAAPSFEFHSLLQQVLPANYQAVNAKAVHYVLDDKVAAASEAQSIQLAMAKAATSSIDSLRDATLNAGLDKSVDTNALIAKNEITFVIVPGIFGEFIKTRAFEEVFARQSSFRTQFAQAINQASKSGNANAIDASYRTKHLKEEAVRLDEVVNAASIDDAQGKPLIKIVLLKTPFLSLETLGDLSVRAKMFNRRLQKFVNLTHPKNLALVGYSRGTTTGLEMLSQAKAANLGYLANVRGMVSLAGVVSGSSLADEIVNPASPNFKLVGLMTKLLSDLQVPQSGAGFFANTQVVTHNTGVWTKFLFDAGKIAASMPKPKDNGPDEKELASKASNFSLDAGAPFDLVKKMFVELGLNNPVSDYANNIVRFKTFVQQTLIGVNQLRTAHRVNWWKTHTVPTQGITYYSLAATMADPGRTQFEKALFANKFGYSFSYDDKSLLQNHRDYVTSAHIGLNDSQVSVAQAMFLPNVIEKLNPAQAAMKIENLGILSTHHWGVALRVVNEMKDGRVNPFPREAILKALAAKISGDL